MVLVKNRIEDLLRAFTRGDLTVVGETRECLDRIDRLNGEVNAVVTLDAQGARARAAAIAALSADHKAALPLCGVPVTVKDAFATAGLRTTASYPGLAAHVPSRDATVVARLRQAGAVLLGKTNLSRLAGDPQCDSPIFGLTRNPWNRDLTSGGSSGGAAVAVAMGFSQLDPGSDLGGSIRIPAAYCGVYGLKATENRIPRTGHIPHLPGQPRCVRHMLSFGVLTRSVEDLAIGLSVLAGPDGEDTEVLPVRPSMKQVKAQSPRIAWWDDFAGLPLCERTRAALDRTVARLGEAGFELVRCAPKGFDIDRALYAYGVLVGSEVGLGFRPWERQLIALARHVIPRRQHLTRAFTQGMAFDWRRYNDALNIREELINALDAFLGEWDVWMCPTAPRTAYPHVPLKPLGKPPMLEVSGRRLPYLEATVSMVGVFSLTGNPVVVMPVGLTDGLPVGLQFTGRRWGDETLIHHCRKIDEVLGGFTPPMAAQD